MIRLKENQEAIDRGEWNNMPNQQREELEDTFRHTGRIARYTNIMGIKTVKHNCLFTLIGNILLLNFS